MKLNPNCSEAVFRFYTLEPTEIQQVLQAIANEISANTDFKPHKNQQVPLLESAEDYQNIHNRATEEQWDAHFKKTGKIRKDFDDGIITKEEFEKRMNKEYEKFEKIKYPNGSLLMACAGLGDNEAVITIERELGAFRLNIGNNDISNDTTGWIENIESMNIRVEEAETNEDLAKHARDCTCGIVFFPSSARKEQQESTKKLIEEMESKSKKAIDTSQKLGE